VIEEGKFESFDTHNSFFEAFAQIRDIIEIMACLYLEKDRKLIDKVTRASLLEVDENGNLKVENLAPIFKHSPEGTLRSDELKKIYLEEMTEDERAYYRTVRADRNMAALIVNVLNDGSMAEINVEEYEAQFKNGEVTLEMNQQKAADPVVVEPAFDEDGQPIDGENNEEENNDEDEDQIDIAPEVDEVNDPGEKMEIPQQEINAPPVMDFFGLPIGPPKPAAKEEEGDEEDKDEEDFLELDPNRQASTEVINNLLKLSQELDNEGKTNESVELLRLAKKFSGNFK